MARDRKAETEIFPDIPVNFDDGFHILGFTLKRRFLIDAAIIGLFLGFIVYMILYNIFYFDNGIYMWIYCIVAFGFGFSMGVMGKNADPWSVYLTLKLKHFIRRRITLYNSRIKYEKINEQKAAYEESTVMDDEGETGQSIYNKFMKKMAERARTASEASDKKAEAEETYVFEDDIGVSNDVPEEIRKQYERQMKGGFNFGKRRQEKG